MVSIQVNEEKSIFERAVVEAFKQKKSANVYEKLSIALDEIKLIKSEIKIGEDQGKKYFLNKNIIDKMNRIQERKLFNVNLLISKIYENLLDSNYYDYISNDIDLLIRFSNEILNLLEMIKSTLVSKQLEIKCSCFLNYLSNLNELNEEQKNIISDLLNSFPTRNSSETYKTFDQISERIMVLCSSTNLDEKNEGVTMLVEAFGNTYSLDEQFDILIEKVPPIIKCITNHANPEFKESYNFLAHFMCSLLFNTQYKIDSYIPDYKVNLKDINKNYFFIFKGSTLIDEVTKDEISFLHDQVFELTTQKDLLLNCDNIFNLCKIILETIIIYESSFDLQFISYIILKRIYFTFPQFKKSIEESLALVLTNICLFKEKYELDNSQDCIQFLIYLLSNNDVDQSLKSKIQKRIEAKKIKIDFDNIEQIKFQDIDKDILKLSDFNLKVGYPLSVEVDAGCIHEKYLEIYHPNSIIYLGFSSSSNDINFELLKYENKFDFASVDTENNELIEDSTNFKTVIKIQRIDSSMNPVKMILFVKEPGTYKMIFDNSYSWFTGKFIRYRFSVLKPLTDIDTERIVNFEELRARNLNHKIEGSISISNTNTTIIDKDLGFLNLKYEGKNKNINLSSFVSKQKSIRNNDFYLTIPVIVSRNCLRIINEKGEPIEFDLSDEDIKNYHSVFERKIMYYLESFENFSQRITYINVFVLDKAENQTDISSNPSTQTKNISNKLGFYPQNLMNLSKNIHLTVLSYSDSCLIYHLAQKSIAKLEFNNVLYIHVDKHRAQVSMYMEGLINDMVGGLEYDKSKTLNENVKNFVEFFSLVKVIFGNLEFCFSFSDINPNETEEFYINLCHTTDETFQDQKPIIEKNGHEFINNMYNFIQLLQLHE